MSRIRRMCNSSDLVSPPYVVRRVYVNSVPDEFKSYVAQGVINCTCCRSYWKLPEFSMIDDSHFCFFCRSNKLFAEMEDYINKVDGRYSLKRDREFDAVYLKYYSLFGCEFNRFKRPSVGMRSRILAYKSLLDLDLQLEIKRQDYLKKLFDDKEVVKSPVKEAEDGRKLGEIFHQSFCQFPIVGGSKDGVDNVLPLKRKFDDDAEFSSSSSDKSRDRSVSRKKTRIRGRGRRLRGGKVDNNPQKQETHIPSKPKYKKKVTIQEGFDSVNSSSSKDERLSVFVGGGGFSDRKVNPVYLCDFGSDSSHSSLEVPLNVKDSVYIKRRHVDSTGVFWRYSNDVTNPVGNGVDFALFPQDVPVKFKNYMVKSLKFNSNVRNPLLYPVKVIIWPSDYKVKYESITPEDYLLLENHPMAKVCSIGPEDRITICGVYDPSVVFPLVKKNIDKEVSPIGMSPPREFYLNFFCYSPSEELDHISVETNLYYKVTLYTKTLNKMYASTFVYRDLDAHDILEGEKIVGLDRGDLKRSNPDVLRALDVVGTRNFKNINFPSRNDGEVKWNIPMPNNIDMNMVQTKLPFKPPQPYLDMFNNMKKPTPDEIRKGLSSVDFVKDKEQFQKIVNNEHLQDALDRKGDDRSTQDNISVYPFRGDTECGTELDS